VGSGGWVTGGAGGHWCRMVGSDPGTVLMAGAFMSTTRPAVKQGRVGANRWAPATVSGGGGLNTIQIQMNSNYFKTFQKF
jgi:hypothetical protein